MNCLICRQAETFEGFTSVLFERAEIRIVLTHVPARVCPGCGESYVDEDVAERLLLKADNLGLTGELSGNWEYE